MTWAAAILGEQRPPQWQGVPRVVHSPMSERDPDVPDAIARAVESRRINAARKKAEHAANLAQWVEIGQIIAARRRAMGLRQYECAALLGVGNGTVSDFEVAKRAISEHFWPQIKAVLGVDVAALLGRAE